MLILLAAVLAQAPATIGAPAAQAAPVGPTLSIGSPAPKPDISNFVKGEAPEFFTPGKTYVVEFWATWCGPCRAGMPHLSETAEKYAEQGVSVVGISDEKLDVVAAFLAKPEWQEKVRYIVATDPDGSTNKQYMEAAGENGIPCAFIVKDNTVQWIGHPMTMDEPLAQIVGGTWDIAAAKKSRDTEMAAELAQAAVQSKLRAALKAKDWPAAIAIYDEAIAANNTAMRTSIQMAKFQTLAGPAAMPSEAYTLAREIISGTDHPMILNEIAWFTATDKAVKTRDLEVALLAAEKANTASKGEDAAILDTLARVWWEKGDRARAIQIQTQAAAAAGDDQMGTEIKATLKQYKAEANSAG